MIDEQRISMLKNIFLTEGVDNDMAEYLLNKDYELIEDYYE